MKRSDSLRRLFPAVMTALVAGLLTFASCTDVDDTLGSNLIPDNQQMKAGFVTLDSRIGAANPKQYVATRLFQTDSIVSSNIENGYLGTMISDTFGIRKAGFLSQYTSYYTIPEGYFGYRPIFDSAQILLSIGTFGADTLTDIEFGVYEITSNDYLTEKPVAEGKTERDTTFFVSFNPEQTGYAGNIVGDKLFTFSIGAGNNTGPATTAITMTPTPAGVAFVERLMLQKGKYSMQEGVFDPDYSIYSTDSLKYWVEEFKGLYIKPETELTATNGGVAKGTIYSTALDASGFLIYGRNRLEENPSLIKDTIGMVYYFYDSYAEYGNVSVNSVQHDYANAKFRIEDAREANPDGSPNENRPENATLFVAGMGGVLSQISFTEAFFDELEAILSAENQDGDNYRTLAFSQARMSIYFWGSGYDWTSLPNIPHLIDQMNAAQSRLGLYTDIKSLSPITDYAFLYESSYSTTLAYDGYINRSRGCYVMDITGYMQELWNNYKKERATATAENRGVDYDKIENRTITLGPDAYDLFTTSYSVLQGMPGTGLDGSQNNASIRLDLTYNMIK